MPELYDLIRQGCAEGAAPGFVRIRGTYEPAAGPGTLVSPPSYPAADRKVTYAFEHRWVDGQSRTAVRIDAVASQANRIEEALDDLATQVSPLPIPRFVIDFGDRRISSLELPHRIHDAYLASCETADGTAFPASDVGSAVLGATLTAAAPLVEYAPEALAFGAWDSHRRASSARLSRSYESSMSGLAAGDVAGSTRAAVRVDPLNLSVPRGTLRRPGGPGEWEMASAGKGDGTMLSDVGLGPVPSLTDGIGGVSVERVERVALVLFANLRRLRFPTVNGERDPNRDVAGRALVAAYALWGDRLAFGSSALCLRSGCSLLRTDEVVEVLPLDANPVRIDLDDAMATYAEAVDEAARVGLVVSGSDIVLRPDAKLAAVARMTREAKAPTVAQA